MSLKKSLAYIYIASHSLSLFFITSCRDYDEHSFTWNADGVPVYTWQTTIRSEKVISTLTGYGWKLYESYIINADGTDEDLFQNDTALPLAYFFFSPDSVAVFTVVDNDTISIKHRYSFMQESNKLLIDSRTAMTLTHLNRIEWWAVETADTLYNQALFVNSMYSRMSQDGLDSLLQLSSFVNSIGHE